MNELILKAKSLLNAYVTSEQIGNFSEIPVYVKLELLQTTPKIFIKQREIAKGETYHYIDHTFSKKCLNFAFNFGVSNEVTGEQYYEYDEEYSYQVKDAATKKMVWKKGTRHVIEAECTIKFTFNWDGQQIIRTVHSSHKQFKNPAICRGDAMQAAVSKAWTKVAATFGIGADLEDDYYAKTKPQKDEDVIDVESVETPPTKSFDPGF